VPAAPPPGSSGAAAGLSVTGPFLGDAENTRNIIDPFHAFTQENIWLTTL